MDEGNRLKSSRFVVEWQRMLGQIIENEQILVALADELGMHPDTLKRWTQGTTPRNAIRTLRTLCSASSFPTELRGAFTEAVSKSYPDFGQVPNPLLENIPVKEIPSEFYSQIYRSYAYVASDLVFWTLANTVCHWLFGHLDADQSAGVSAAVLLCTPPANSCVQSLYAPAKQIGERPSPLPTTFPLVAGIESPLTDVTPRYQRPSIFSEQDIRAFTSLSFPVEVVSLLSVPIQRRGKVAGCFLMSSHKQSYWNDQRSLVAYEYSLLMGLAFHDQDFYSREQLCFGSYPSAALQQRQESIYPFRQRLIDLRRERRHLSSEQLEVLALQGLEEELLRTGKKNE